MISQTLNAYSRRLEDFLTPAIAEKAGVVELRRGPSPLVITGLEYDSRKVKPGNLYFALPGLHADGHDFIPEALERSAAAVVHQNELGEYRNGVLYIKVKDSRFAMSPLADAFYDFPSRRLAIIGVTGTEGKSTTVYLIFQLLKFLGKKTGFISTVYQGDGISENFTVEHQTTPEAVTIQRLLAQMCQNGAGYAVLESSSHGLSKRTNRLGDVAFDAAVMTTVTHEHLEFHGSWEQYRSDKAELFRSLDSSSHRKQGQAGEISVPAFGVANADDPSAVYFAAATKQKTFTFSTKGAQADLSLRSMESTSAGNLYEAIVGSSGEILTIRDELPGAFNAGNVFAALLAVSNLLSMEIRDLVSLVPRLKPVRGRMNPVRCGQPFEVIVDYAHTPSSFETIFPPLRERLNASGGRLISLFGSAGERDTGKRPKQGEIAAIYSDIVFLSDEDPRGEEPMSILEDIAKGCEAASGCEATQGCEAASGCETTQGCEARRMIRNETLFLIPGRPQAIRKAFSLARKGDLVLLLGKGHENSIIYAKGTIPYDETAEAEKALEEMGYCEKL